MVKKIFALFMAVSVLGMVAAGCSGGGEAEAEKPAAEGTTTDAAKTDGE